jgi:hypothetical protein
MRPIRIVGKVIGVIVVVTLATLLFGFFVKLLWNGLMPEIFHFGMITFWQAVGLLVLARILFFRGFGGRHGHGWHGGPGCYGGKWGYWHKWRNMTPEEREKMKEGWYSWKDKWHNMTTEEKARMKAQWKERCRNWDSSWEEKKSTEEKKEDINN